VKNDRQIQVSRSVYFTMFFGLYQCLVKLPELESISPKAKRGINSHSFTIPATYVIISKCKKTLSPGVPGAIRRRK
ncbi:MAG: hypothetical protein IJO79_00450, partial [Firmicutes bacterium]|nr:hypothetical protein [Bacillota bacterium]